EIDNPIEGCRGLPREVVTGQAPPAPQYWGESGANGLWSPRRSIYLPARSPQYWGGRGGLTSYGRQVMSGRGPHVIIVGGGFGGLAAAKALRKAPVRITLIDRTNHHAFQPLLYQVATSVLSPSQIAAPIRGILHGQQNTNVILGEVTGVDKE